jgi:hypothetical protein
MVHRRRRRCGDYRPASRAGTTTYERDVEAFLRESARRQVRRLRQRPDALRRTASSHVAGIIAGNGKIPTARRPTRPKRLLVVEGAGRNSGTISSIISALGWVQNAKTYNIAWSTCRSVRAFPSLLTDPLTLATKVLTDQGITVVTAAGNIGRTRRASSVRRHHCRQRRGAHGCLEAWARSHATTTRWPTSVLRDRPRSISCEARPNGAPGVGTVSLAVRAPAHREGHLTAQRHARLGSKPESGLSGTSMAAPVEAARSR